MDRNTLRSTLSQRLAEVLDHNQRVGAHLRHSAGLPDDWPERAALLADDEVLATLDQEGRAQVSALRAALIRLDDGTYGDCAGCGEPVGEDRLRALPLTTTCVGCAA